ncbi:MAG: AAA family ATPase, partial [Clostridiales bacterium]|nr:AAA family ATPase [Clostridiales bacterium]
MSETRPDNDLQDKRPIQTNPGGAGDPPRRPPRGGASAGGDPGRSGRWIAVFFVLTFLFNVVGALMAANSRGQIEYSQFVRLVESGSVRTVQIEDEQLLLRLRDDADPATVAGILNEGGEMGAPNQADARRQQSSVYYAGLVDDPSLTQLLLSHGVSFYRPIKRTNPIVEFIGTWVIPVLLMYFLFHLLGKGLAGRIGGMGGGMMGVGKSKARMYDMQTATGVSFSDVAGQDEAKESLMEIIDYLHDPSKYQRIGARQP